MCALCVPPSLAMDVDISSELVNIVLPAAAVNQLHVQRVMVIFIVRQFTNGGPSLGASKSLVPHQASKQAPNTLPPTYDCYIYSLVLLPAHSCAYLCILLPRRLRKLLLATTYPMFTLYRLCTQCPTSHYDIDSILL